MLSKAGDLETRLDILLARTRDTSSNDHNTDIRELLVPSELLVFLGRHGCLLSH